MGNPAAWGIGKIKNAQKVKGGDHGHSSKNLWTSFLKGKLGEREGNLILIGIPTPC